MAIMTLNNRMCFWKIYLGKEDMTDILGHFVSSIKIKDTIMPLPKKSKKEHAPGEAYITITSKDYVEDFFTHGNKIKICMGYDRIIQPEVFSGIIVHYPDGRAREMIDYTVKAFSSEIEYAYKEKIRVFPAASKAMIIAQIAAENDWTPKTQIRDTSIIKAHLSPIQIGKTDLEILYDFAREWSCICWFDVKNKIINFVDADRAHMIAFEASQSEPPGPYILGYRNDQVPNNVESVSWKQEPPRSIGSKNGGVMGYNELGAVELNVQGKILALGKTWELKPQYIFEAINKPWMFGKYFALVLAATIAGQAYDALRTFYCVKTFDDNHQTVETVPNASGFKIEVSLNEGDPDVKPPRQAILHAGSISPRADSSFLPAWLFTGSGGMRAGAELNINETELSLEHGMLKTKLTCSMGL